MKVFISWSGTRSHRIGLVLREWLPSVIQSIEPYLSSEDIDKGARWSIDIAKELEASAFGVLCVTKDNIESPWLVFEAGALSKTMDKTCVCPFLFDIKRSEVQGPILQFQSTIFNKEDIFKLVKSMNSSCGEWKMNEERLKSSFAVWYPTLEESLNRIRETPEEELGNKDTIHSMEVLEEVLDLSRNNQKLLRLTESKITDDLSEIKELFKETRQRELREKESRIENKRMQNYAFEEFATSFLKEQKSEYMFLVVLGMLRDDLPWLYEAGRELVATMKSESSKDEKKKSFVEFKELVDYSFRSRLMMRSSRNERNSLRYFRDTQYIILEMVEQLFVSYIE